MNQQGAPSRPVRIAIALYCAGNCGDLLTAWRQCGYDRHAWVALLAWGIPPLIAMLPGNRIADSGTRDTLLLGAALACSLAGRLASMHFLQHIGLALAIAAWVPPSRSMLAWLLSSVAWMPALGWVGSRLFPGQLLPARLLFAFAAAVWLSLHLSTKRSPIPCKTGTT